MKKAAVILVLVLTGFLFMALKADSGMNFQERNIMNMVKPEKYSHDAKEFNMKPGAKLNVDLKSGGSIEIQGWNENKVSVEVEGRSADEVDLSFEQTDDVLEISNENDMDDYDGNINLIIKVPTRFDIEIYSSGGEVEITNVEGNIEGETMGGDLTLNNLKGSLKLHTMGGAISLKDSEVDGSVKTMGGEVLVENVKGDVDASSMGGQVRQINVEGKEKSVGKEVNISTMGGDLNIDKAPNGAHLKTMGGEIKANHVGVFADVETMGGDVEIKEVDGWVKAKTMGGDIIVKMIGNPDDGNRDVMLTSLGGDINLTVPENLSMNIEIEIAYTKHSHKNFEDFKIVSDFSTKEERSTEWDRSQGTPRKYITASGITGNGKNKIKIKTINGNVYLKKS